MELQMENELSLDIKTEKIKDGIILNKDIKIDSFILVGEINNNDLIDKLIINIKNKIKDSKISGLTNIKAQHSEFSSLVEEPNFHEFLKLIQPSIYCIYKRNFIIRNAWGNIYSKKDLLINMSRKYRINL